MPRASLKDNLQQIRHRLEDACRRAGRKPAEVELLAVCKGQEAGRVREAWALGLRRLGENRQQEGEAHMQALAGCAGLRWHFIGRLQKNKINKILSQYDLVESVDSVKALEHIHKRVDAAVEVYIEINVGEEPNKAGFTPDTLRRALAYIAQLGRVRIAGLLAVPPYCEDPAAVRPYFARLRELRDELNRQAIANVAVRHLSMGMSHDFEQAIAEGATEVRIGSALFGARPRP